MFGRSGSGRSKLLTYAYLVPAIVRGVQNELERERAVLDDVEGRFETGETRSHMTRSPKMSRGLWSTFLVLHLCTHHAL